MGACLKKVTGAQPVDASERDVANAVGLVNYHIKDSIAKNVVLRVLNSSKTCDFETLQSLVANLHPSNKTWLKRIIMSGGLAFWNPETNSEYRFWD